MPVTRKKPPVLPPTGPGPEVETPACLWGKGGQAWYDSCREKGGGLALPIASCSTLFLLSLGLSPRKGGRVKSNSRKPLPDPQILIDVY